jgi:carboxyl-terminal processing protease
MRKSATVVIAIALLAAGTVSAQDNAGQGGVYESLNLFDQAFERVRQDAVEAVGDDKLLDAAISGMLSGLDPHSVYLDETALKALRTPGAEQSGDIGLVVTLDHGVVKVISPQDGSPAAAAGLTPGDAIFTIDKEPTYDLNLTQVEQKLRGAAGSEVALMLRRGSAAPSEVKVGRADWHLQTVSGHIEGGNIGYVRIAGFDDGTAAALAKTVEDLRQQAQNRLIGFIIDLRNNPGGAFDAAVASADALIDKGDIALVKGRKAADVKRIAATPGDIAKGLPVVALVNGGTARESELVAGALQDNRRAVLLGTKTYGESGITSVIPLESGGAIRLTTARFETPAGREINGKGLDPDLTVGPLKLEKLAQGDVRREADLPGALKNPEQAPAKPPENAPPGATATPPAKEAPSVATEDIGSASDEQLTEGIDVLRGLARFKSGSAG